jgi:hypothetical protein
MSLAAALLFAVLGADEEVPDCPLNPAAIRSQLDPEKSAPDVKLLGAQKKGRLHRERLKLPDGLEVTVAVGGCAHLGLSVELRGRAAQAATPAQALELFRKVLETLPVRADAHLRPQTFLDALAKKKDVEAAFPVKLDCGEFETCELTRETKGGVFLKLGYDFQL